jgi:methionine-rich copper-binding protein CopC
MRLRPAALAAASLAILSCTGPAFAHAYYVKSDPAAGSTVDAAPKMLTITYTEDLDLAFCSVTVTDGMGMNDAAGKPQPVPGHANEMQIPLHIQMPGKITVTWHALSTDTHKTDGHFSFTVAKL